MSMVASPNVPRFIVNALVSSVYVSPTDPGLTLQELEEVAAALGYMRGELHDALRTSSTMRGRNNRFLPDPGTTHSWLVIRPEVPEFRNFQALDFIWSEFRAQARSAGATDARLDRSVVIERGRVQGLSGHDVEVALTIGTMQGRLIEEKGVLRATDTMLRRPNSPSQERDLPAVARLDPSNPGMAAAYPVVKDVIERRSDGRPQHAEPLAAFGRRLDGLGYGAFRLWWTQMASEVGRADAQTSPVSILVLSAGLVEAALAFVVKHARDRRLPVFGSREFERDPKQWRIEDLIAGAAYGDAAILDDTARRRALALVATRQRIHAGRLLSEHSTGPIPDLRPEEARDAKAVADLVVRAVLSWLERYPPA